MADTKPFEFPVLSAVNDNTEIYTQPGGTTDRKFTLLTLWNYIRTKISGGAASISDGGNISVNADELVVAVSFLSTTNQTINVGTTAGGTEILQGVELTAGQLATEIIHSQFTAAGALYFTFPGGDVTVRVKKF